MKPIILPYKGEFSPLLTYPRIDKYAYVAPGAAIIGDVKIGAHSSVWFNCTVRGDVNYIEIGARTNIQDGSTIHVTRRTGPTIIGDDITIGHGVILHACTLKDRCFIGMGATIMDDVVVQTGAMVAAGALVTPGKIVPSGELWAGSPARKMRDLSEAEVTHIQESADNYVRLANEFSELYRKSGAF